MEANTENWTSIIYEMLYISINRYISEGRDIKHALSYHLVLFPRFQHDPIFVGLIELNLNRIIMERMLDPTQRNAKRNLKKRNRRKNKPNQDQYTFIL